MPSKKAPKRVRRKPATKKKKKPKLEVVPTKKDTPVVDPNKAVAAINAIYEEKAMGCLLDIGQYWS